MDKLQQAKRRLSEISDQAHAIYNEAKSQSRDLELAEAEQLDKLLNEAEALKRKIQLSEINDWLDQPTKPRIPPQQPGAMMETGDTEYFQETTYRHARSAQKVHVLNRGEQLTDRLGGQGDLTLGGFLKAAVLGTGEGSRYRNTLLESTDSSGGYTVPDVLSAQLIDRLRAKSVLMTAGATTLVLPDGGEVSMAKLTGDPSTA